ncbi:hypothetical protein [Mesoterricola silvestris]|uniref:Uncharacterized protein n=1 Tax=Mesoterricola silvestris TaxID=2927979 RepID=A0AA48K9H5_9BACT|nr:hypothetical protein [Mesoterricola silvestris]BDU72337.1 hypothetical protein METEAL_15110 [Mesoterricola silvestris]
MSRVEPYRDLGDPELSVYIHQLCQERSKPNPDLMVQEELRATIARIKDARLIAHAERKAMEPELAAILRPVSKHLRVAL